MNLETLWGKSEMEKTFDVSSIVLRHTPKLVESTSEESQVWGFSWSIIGGVFPTFFQIYVSILIVTVPNWR